MESMIQYQERRRQELRLQPHSIAKAVKTSGEGTTGNRAHLNLTKSLPYIRTKHRRVIK
jgi:hypothetical protein